MNCMIFQLRRRKKKILAKEVAHLLQDYTSMKQYLTQTVAWLKTRNMERRLPDLWQILVSYQ